MVNIMTDLTPTEMAGYYRSGAAIVNTDPDSLEAYKKKKLLGRRMREMEKRIEELEKCVRFLMDNKNNG